MSEAAWSNMICAMPECDFVSDVGRAVSNDGNAEEGARYLLSRASDFLRSKGQSDGVIAAFDFAIFDIEAIADIWPAFQLAADQYGFGHDQLPALARFIADRLPAIWERPWAGWNASVSRAVALADRIDTLVGMFAAGMKPNGSKDPFALRRAANELLGDIAFPCRIIDSRSTPQARESVG